MEDKVVIDVLKELRNELLQRVEELEDAYKNVVTIQSVIESHSYMKT